MIYSMFSIYDSKAEAFLPPFILPNVNMAQRAFDNCVNSETHQFHANPEDFTLMMLGRWDDENGKLQQLATPRSLGLALEYVRHDNAEDHIPESSNGEDKKAGESTDSPIRSDGEGANLTE